jgi:DNA ligase-1
MTNEIYNTLFKRDTTGGVRVWFMERDAESYRTISGIQDGTMVTTGWVTCVPKNVGRSNETTAIEQAEAEVAATYTKKLKTGYFTSVDEIDNVAFTKPMLAQDIEKREGKWSFPVYAQPKLDGMRCIARADGLWTRTGKPITACPHIMEELKPIFDLNPDLILDGELYNHKLKDDFNGLMSICRKQSPTEDQLQTSREMIEYHVYDMPSHEGNFIERYSSAVSLLIRQPPLNSICVVPTTYVTNQEDLDADYTSWLQQGYEGQMVRLEGEYEFKRSNNLMKRKTFISEEFPVLRMEEGNGNWAGAVKRFIIQLPNGIEGEATPKGKYEDLAALWLAGDTPDWATIQHFGFTPAGKLRFPTAHDWGQGERAD